MEELKFQSDPREVKIRVYDAYNRIYALWVCGCSIEPSVYEGYNCFEFSADTMLPLSICVATNCKKPSVSVMSCTPANGQVYVRGDKWGLKTARLPYNLAEFQIRALGTYPGTVEFMIYVFENASTNC